MSNHANRMDALNVLLGKAIDLKGKMDQASRSAQERANEAEGAMVSRYDTFKEEGQYLAGGLKIRAMEAASQIEIIRSAMECLPEEMDGVVRLYAFVGVEFADGQKAEYFLFPVMGGEKIGNGITVITPDSPLGRTLMNREEGEIFSYGVNGNTRKGEIIDVR